VALQVRPLFDPEAVRYAMLFYAMQTDGNGLPDGFDEIGLYVDSKQLCAKVVGHESTTPFARLPVEDILREGQWTHLALSWQPGRRELYVNGRRVVQRDAPYEAPRLDEFPAEVGRHVSSRSWPAPGIYARIRLYDDALDEAEVARLAAEGADEVQTAAPPPEVIGACDWDRPWLGANRVKATVGNPTQAPLALRVALELSSGEPFVRRERGARALRLEPGATEEMDVAYEVTADGPARLALLVFDETSGRLLAGRLRHGYVPPVLGALADHGRLLDEAAAGPLSAELRALLDQAREKLERRRRDFLAERPADDKAAEARLEELRAELAEEKREVTRLASAARVAAAAAGQPFALGWTHGTIKVLKHDPFPGHLEEPIALEAARGEYEPAQVFVFATGRALEGVKLELSELRGPDGATIGGEDLSWREVGYAVTTQPSYQVRHVGEWPDPLYPVESFSVPASDHRIAWLTVHVPREARPGDYEGTVTVTCAEGQRSLPLRLHVWNFALPERSSLPTMYGLNSCGRWQSAMDVERYARNAAEHRVSLGFPGIPWHGPKVTRPSFDWSGHESLGLSVRGEGEGVKTGALYLVCEGEGRERATYGPIAVGGEPAELSATLREPRVFRSVRMEWRGTGPVRIQVGALRLRGGDRAERTFDDLGHGEWWRATAAEARVAVGDGRLTLSVAAPEDGAEPYESWAGAERLASDSPAETDWQVDFTDFDAAVEKYYPWAANVIWLPLPSVPREATLEEAQRAIAESGLARIAAAAEAHLREKGWLDVAYTYLWDEPEGKQYPVVELLMRTVKEAAPGLRNMMTARGFPPALENVDIWCPELYSFDPEGAERERGKGSTLWWYVAFSCRHPYPNFWTDYPALDCRVVTWLTWKHKMEGFLYWSISNWWRVGDPLREQTFPRANGDGTLVYPGEDGGPVDTIRWENIREGLEDYEYFVLLQELAETGVARGRPEAAVRRARELLAIDDALVKDYANWSGDPEAYLKARGEMARAIEELM